MLVVVCVLAVVLCVLGVVLCVCSGEVGAFGGEGGERVCVCMMVVGSANEVKWVDSCGGEMSWTAVVERWDGKLCIRVGYGKEMWP